MKLKLYFIRLVVLLTIFLTLSCEDFVTIEPPSDKLVREDVFSSEESAISAMTGIYNELFQASFSNGSRNSVTFLAGLSADNIKNISSTNLALMEFQKNELMPDNQHNLEIWSSAYNIIYMTNSFLEGLEFSDEVSPEIKDQLEGEARFVRAFAYFYLVNLYGEVPLLLTTDYRSNELASRHQESEIYSQIIYDLTTSRDLLSNGYKEGERTRVNRLAATALLARVHLFIEDWEMAEDLSEEVINESSTYEILENLDEVFLANSREAIWQISPIGGGGIVTHTNEGSLFIIDPVFSFFASLELREEFVETFQEEDKRLSQWIGFNRSRNAYFPFKYKIRNSSEFPIREYSMVLRLAEQYLIRAEARTQRGNIAEGIEDLDVIRNRAGIALIAETKPQITKEELLSEILEERRKELFAEWGHRWFDLKRTGRAAEVLGTDNPFWENTDVLYPIPSEERMKNPNLTQNPGY